jgi:hypothetical protein
MKKRSFVDDAVRFRTVESEGSWVSLGPMIGNPTEISPWSFSRNVLANFIKLTQSDILLAMKSWRFQMARFARGRSAAKSASPSVGPRF